MGARGLEGLVQWVVSKFNHWHGNARLTRQCGVESLGTSSGAVFYLFGREGGGTEGDQVLVLCFFLLRSGEGRMAQLVTTTSLRQKCLLCLDSRLVGAGWGRREGGVVRGRCDGRGLGVRCANERSW